MEGYGEYVQWVVVIFVKVRTVCRRTFNYTLCKTKIIGSLVRAGILSHPAAKWVAGRFGWLALVGAGITMAQWDEYAVAAVLFAFSGVVLLLNATYWNGIEARPKVSRALKVIFIVGAIIIIIGSYPITLAKKGNKPWSSFIATRRHNGPLKPPSTALVVRGYIQGSGYPVGLKMYGIVWFPQFTDVRVNLSNPTDSDYNQLDLAVSLDEGTQVFEYGQITDIPMVSFPRNPDAVVQGNPMITYKDQNGTATTTPDAAQPGVDKLRILADKLPSHGTLELVLATMHFGSVSELKLGKLPNIRQQPKLIVVDGEYFVKGSRESVHNQIELPHP